MPKLLYQGHGSFRITADDGRVIFVDPAFGDGYDKPADLILVTHGHSDHNRIELCTQNEGCRVITYKEALVGGKHNGFDLKWVKVKAVEASNSKHNPKECVGYIITIDGVKIYASGDTSKTETMQGFAALKLDYALFCGDGKYNMDIEEAAECAKLVGALSNILIHTVPDAAALFDQAKAERWEAPNKVIIEPNDEIQLYTTEETLRRRYARLLRIKEDNDFRLACIRILLKTKELADFRSIILKFVDEFTIGQEAAAYRAELVRQAKKRAAAEALLSIETPEHPIPLERLDELKNDGLFATDDDMTTLESRKITCPDGSIVEVKTSRAVLQILDELTDTEQKHDRKHDRKKFLAPSNLRGGESGNNITPKEYIEAKMSRTFTASDRGSVLRIIKDREHSERLEITREFHYRWHREIKARLHELLSETQAKYYYEYQYNGCKYYKRIGDLYGVSLQAVKKVLTAEKFVARISANRLYKIEPSAELFSWYETEIAKLHTAETYSAFEALIKKIIAGSKK